LTKVAETSISLPSPGIIDATASLSLRNLSKASNNFEALSCQLMVEGKPIDVPVNTVAISNPGTLDETILAGDGSTKFLPAGEQTFEGTHQVELFCEAAGTELTVDTVNLLAWSTG
jgi:hypothetical protein